MPPGAVTVAADPERLGQVVANLLENALKFARHDRGRHASRAGGDRAELAVDDDGPGIAAEDLPHVFERLYVAAPPARPAARTAPASAWPSSASWSSAMGGTVRAERAASGGARLVVDLPLTAAATPAAADSSGAIPSR